MRLTPAEIQAIKAAVVEVFGPDAVVRLFGSRVDDRKRGGDIDLHITFTPERTAGLEPMAAHAAFLHRLFQRMEERRIDVVLRAVGAAARPIDLAALSEGLAL